MATSHSPIIVALDVPTEQAALELVSCLRATDCKLKVGKELFTRAGPAFIEKLHQLGFDVFLDLKYHDIPNTVAKACQAAAELGVWMVNVHAWGASQMMLAAREAVDKYQQKPLLIAVTVLTSLQQADLAELGIQTTPQDMVLRLAKLAQNNGLDGVVCSPQEIQLLREQLPRDFQLVTPGIRPAGSAKNDQKRTLTPAQALQAGSNYLVIGRPITAAPAPLLALQNIIAGLRSEDFSPH